MEDQAVYGPVPKRTFRKFTPKELEVHKDLLLKRASELTKLEQESRGIAEKMEWLKNNLADLVRKIQEGGTWE